MNLLTAKIIAMTLMGLLALFFGLLPLKVKSMILKGDENSRKRRRRERFISGLLCFGSGVLLATVFIHMIPETREGFERALGQSGSNSHESQGLHSHNSPNHSSHDHSAHDHSSHDHAAHEHPSSENDDEKKNLAFLRGQDGDHVHSIHNTHPNAEGAHKDNTENHPQHHEHVDDHDPHDPHSHVDRHDKHESGPSENMRKNADLRNPEVVKPGEHKIISPEKKDSDVHAHDEHDPHMTAEVEHLREKALTGHQNESENTQDDPELERPDQVFRKENATALPSEKLPDHDIATNHELLMTDEENVTETSRDDNPQVQPHSHAEENFHDHSHDHDHLHDHSHDHDHLHDHPHDHDHSLTSGNTAHLERAPTEIHENEAVLLEDPEAVVSESEKLLEHPKENSIRIHGNGSNDSGEPHFSHLTHNEEDTHNHDHEGHDHEGHGYPLAELSICGGFFLIYLIEEIMHKILFRSSKKETEKKNLLNKDGEDVEEGHSHSHADHLAHIPHFHAHHADSSEEEVDRAHPAEKTTSLNGHPSISIVSEAPDKNMTPRSEWGRHGVDNPVFAGDIDATTWNPKLRNSIVLSNQVEPVPSNESPRNYGTSAASPPSSVSPPPSSASKKKSTSKGFADHILANLRSLLIVIALSFHSVFEGMAVGLQEKVSDVWYLFLAISAHKFVIVFCIGLELLEAGTPLALMILYIFVLALVSPSGIGIGIILTENPSFGGQEHHLIITILQGIAGGTILYVAFLEVLERERSKRGGRLIKLFSLMLGFALMASLEAAGGHSHGPVASGS